jgi:putative ABC transport system permease protein
VTRVALKALWSRKLRTVLTGFAIVLGVATITGTFVLTDSIRNAFDSIFTTIYRGTDAVVTGKAAFDVSEDSGAEVPSFDESLLQEVKALPTVAAAVGGVGGQAQLIDEDGDVIRFGGAPNIGFSVDPTQPRFNSIVLKDGNWPKANQVAIDTGTASKKDIEPGQTIGVQGSGAVRQMRVSGLFDFSSEGNIGGATLAAFDLPTAQRLFNKVGKLDQIRAAAASGTTQPQLVASIEDILPPTAQVRTGEGQADEDASETQGFISFLQGFLLAFGGIALFVGAFVIANSLSITVAQRTREFATLRTIGASRRQIMRAVLIEALVVGLLASVIGIVLGLALAKGLFWLFEQVGFTLPNSGLLLETRTVIVALIVGVLVTVIASLRPARRATRVPPIAAVREGAALPSGRYERNPLIVLLLMIFTLGLYSLYWFYVSFTDVRAQRGKGTPGVVGLLLSLIFISSFLLPSHIGDMYAEAGKEKPVTGKTGFWVFIPLVGGIVWLFKVQRRLNEFWGATPQEVDPAATSKRAVGSAILGLTGFALLAYGLFGPGLSTTQILVAMGLGTLLIFFGVAFFSAQLVTPLAHVLGGPAARLGGAPGILARENAMRNPQRTASTASALMIGLALVTLVAMLAQGIRASFFDAVNKIWVTDYAVTAQNNYSPIPISVAAPLRKAPNNTAVVGVRAGEARIFGSTDFMTGVDPGASEVFRLDWTEGSPQVMELLGDRGAFTDEDYAEDHDLAVGSPVDVQFPSGDTRTFEIRGIFDPPTGGSPFGPITISSKAFDEEVEQPKNLFIFITMQGGETEANTAELERSLAAFPNAKLQNRDEFKDNQFSGIATVLNVLYVLLALSVIVSLFGIVNTLVLSVFERTREIGMLRAVGTTRWQVRTMITFESIVTALMGAAIGIALGVVLAALLIFRVDFLVLSWPIGSLIVFAIAAIFVGVIAAVLPARRAARLNVLEALQYE